MNPLQKLHDQAEAEFQPYGDIEIVCTFGEPQAEYAAVRKGCALFDMAQRRVIQATGRDRIDFLNRLLTNQLLDKDSKTPLPRGAGVYSFLLNNKGRIVADMNVLELGNRTLLETDARNIGNIREVLQKHVFSEKVEFSCPGESNHQIAVHGPGAWDVLRSLFDEIPKLDNLGSVTAKFNGDETVIWRDDACGVPGYSILGASESIPNLWMKILSEFQSSEPGKRQVRPAGWAVFNTARIEAGRAMFGIDFDDTVLPAETSRVTQAVSFTKGCYLGQEIVARMHARGQVARKIIGIRMKEDALPMAGTPILDDQQNQIGGITSSTISPVLSGASIGLGLIKSAFSAMGTEVRIAAEGAIRAGIIAELPFIKPNGSE